MQPNDTPMWRVLHNGRVVECVVRFAPGGVEVEILSDESPLIVHRFTTGTEAMAWAQEAKDDFQPDES